MPQGGNVLHAVASAVIGTKEKKEIANKAHKNIERNIFWDFRTGNKLIVDDIYI